jgi:hypothetical protein
MAEIPSNILMNLQYIDGLSIEVTTYLALPYGT